jgi:hypothetical protein
MSEKDSNIGTKYIDAFTTKEERDRLVEILQGIQPTLDSLITEVNVNPMPDTGIVPENVGAQNIINKILNDQLYFRLARYDYPMYDWLDLGKSKSGLWDEGEGEYYKIDDKIMGVASGLHQKAFEGTATDPTTHKYSKLSQWEKSLGKEPQNIGGYDYSTPDTLFRFIRSWDDNSPKEIAQTILHELIHAAGPLKDSENPESIGPVHDYKKKGHEHPREDPGGQRHYDEAEDVMMEALMQQGTWEEFLEMLPKNINERMFQWPNFRIESK